MAVPAFNPNWPTLHAEGNFGNNPFYTPNASQAFTSLTPRLQKTWSVRRGKQFELDQVQPGEFHGEWGNKDGALDPTNTSGPFANGVLPYRGYRMRAVYPSSLNLVTADQATGGEGTPVAPGAIPASMNIATDVGGATLSIASSGTAFQGSQVFQAAMPASASLHFYAMKIKLQPVQTPTAWLTQTYTWSTYVRCTTTGVNPLVAAAVKFYDINGNYVSDYAGATVTLTGGPAATWTRVSITRAPDPNAAVAELAVALESSPASTWTLQMDGSQYEIGSSPSAFVVPGKNFSVYTGMIERYPQSWEYSGTYGVVQPVCVDTMALLSQTVLKEAFVMDVVATNPLWFFQFNEPSGSTAFSEQAGRVAGTASVFSASLGAGTLTAGNPITAATVPSGKFYGTNGPVVTVNNPTQNQGTVIDMTTAGITSPGTLGSWTRMIAYRCGQTSGTPVFAAYSTGQNPSHAGTTGNMYWGLLHSTGGTGLSVSATFYNAAGQTGGSFAANATNDNNWHLAFVQMSTDGKTISVYSEGVLYSTTFANDLHATLASNESVGGDMYKDDGAVGFGATQYTGDVALYAQWNQLLTVPQMNALRSSFMTAYTGESSDARYGRILGWAGYQGASVLDAGVTTSMTYANDVSGVDALTALQNVVNTESGRHFVGADGTINFQSRLRFFQQGSANGTLGSVAWVFGENQGAGEIPYTELAFDFDPTRISNAVVITQNSTGQFSNAADLTSQQNYGVRSFTRDSQSTNSEEVRGSAFFYLSRYKDPHLRVQALKIYVSGNPTLFPSVLAFEIGQYVQINRRDPFGIRPVITMFGFIEQITHTGDDKGSWFVDLEISPAPSTPYAAFTSLRTTLNATAASGQPTVTINALPDAATNPVRSQLTGGQIMQISDGTNSESLTITTGGVQDALAGYSTATVTFTTNLVHTYAAGTSVVEATGANFDAVAHFDSVQFSY